MVTREYYWVELTWVGCRALVFDLICGQVGRADWRFGAAMGAEHHQGLHPYRGVRHGWYPDQDQVRCAEPFLFRSTPLLVHLVAMIPTMQLA